MLNCSNKINNKFIGDLKFDNLLDDKNFYLKVDNSLDLPEIIFNPSQFKSAISMTALNNSAIQIASDSLIYLKTNE